MRPIVVLLLLFTLQSREPERVLPETAVQRLRSSLASATRHARSTWRDLAPWDAQGQVKALVEIARGDRRKFEFDIANNAMRLDRTIPASLGGYPINYGIVPQTVSYDGDPFDVLVLGPSLASGTIVKGAIVGIMHFEDETGFDSKVVISPVDGSGRPLYALTIEDRDRMARFFDAYKRHQPGKSSRVTGWGPAQEGLAFVRVTHAFFTQCRVAMAACAVDPR
jgi:inorganic pyrophosphatase